MVTAYAAVVSLVHLMEQIQQYIARRQPKIFLDEQQTQLESLRKKVDFLQDFLENYYYSYQVDSSINEAQDLESRIAEATYAAEDIIGTHIVVKDSNRCLRPHKVINDYSVEKEAMKINKGKSTRSLKIHGKRRSNHFSQGLQKVIQEMDSIMKEIAKTIKEESTVLKDDPPVLGSSLSRRSHTMKAEAVVVVFEDVLNQIMDKLTTNQSNLQIIPITGMGGIGKTTLAKNVYVNPFIVQHFDIRGWITISQQYDMRQIILGLLKEIGDRANQNELEYHKLGEKLHKHLTGRRYLIIIDDMWSISAWDELRRYLPDNNNESRILVTTRLSDVAYCIGSSSHPYEMNLLDESNSWNLLCKKVFGQECCPPELEEVGKQIAKSCKGLPLSISVIGGHLANSEMTREHWEYIVSNTNAIANLEDDSRCLKILWMSYNHLPVYLKPCFLYFGIFPEDHEIRVSKLVKSWVAEGFLKPSKSESMEAVAENYLKNLIDRNLISVSMWGSLGHMKYCKIHDLLRDFCLREAEKKRFLCVQNPKVSQDLSSTCRIVIHGQSSDNNEYSFQGSRVLQSASLGRSLACNSTFIHPLSPHRRHDFRPPLSFRLVRMLDVVDDCPRDDDDILELVNAEHNIGATNFGRIPSSICLLWSLHTIIIKSRWTNYAPSEIWEMTQLKHLMIHPLQLPDPPPQNDDCVLKNLQTLSEVNNLWLTKEILGKIPNIKKLKVNYYSVDGDGMIVSSSSFRQFNNLGRLHKLQSVACSFEWIEIENLEFPLSLKKLTLSSTFHFRWEDITLKVGRLPNLEKLRLMSMYLGEEWNPVEGQFLRLKYLEIYYDDLVYWRADETHFPCLDYLVLRQMKDLKEIPSGIGDIPTLQSIQLDFCSNSVVASAKKILEEQRELGNENLRLFVNGIPVEKDSEDDEEEEEETSGDDINNLNIVSLS